MRLVSFCAMLMLAATSFALTPVDWAWSPSSATLSEKGGLSSVSLADAGCFPDFSAVGKPALPQRTVLFAVPDRAAVSSFSFDVDWEPLAENVRVAPVAEPVRDGEAERPAVPDASVYGGTGPYPSEPVVRGAVGTMGGVRVLPVAVTPFRWSPASGLLERAVRVSVRVVFASSSDRSYILSPGLLEGVRAAVVNPSDVAAAPTAAPVRTMSLMSASPRLTAQAVQSVGQSQRTDPVDYLLVSPPDFYEDWQWYVAERKKVHTNLVFRVVNTADIYRDYPFPTDDVRNAAESIHAYLRAKRPSMGFTYIVLGGAWLDAQNLNGYTPYFKTGEMMSLSNCVPGVYGFPREDWRQIPADLFYGCLDLVNGQRYPWDWDNSGHYINQGECSKNDLYPDAIVSRITLNPHSGYGTPYNQHTLITNYVAKLARGEAKDFAGHYRYGMSAASTGSSKLRKTGDRMYYRELEFYDGMRNMFDPLHHDTLEDDEYSVRVRYFDQHSMWRPLRSVKGMMSYTWTGGQPTLSAAMDDYYAGDRDFGYVQAHGWAQGAAQFSAHRFATASGLTLFNGGSGPCETGYPDYHVNSGGRKVLEYNVGDAAVTNPKGGALASVNNSRWSWAGGGGGFAAMSYYMLNEMLIGFNQERKNVGNAWLRGVVNYHPAGKNGGTAGWVLTEQFLYGDPLVRLPEVPNVWWRGGESGVWDRQTENWTNHVDSAKTFDAAYNVYFDVQKRLNLNVTDEIAAMRLSLPVWQEYADVSFSGPGTLRVMQSVDVAGTNTTLRFNVRGGVGHSGIQFLKGAGDLVFEGTNKFYVGGVKNARQVKLLGGGVTLDADEFPAGSFPLVIDGSREETLPLPNELRSKNVGGLRRFGSLTITNSFVKLSTVDAFGNGAPMTHALAGSTLEIAANVYYQRSGFPEGLNATFLVDGDTSVTSSLGGLWTVKHTTTFALGAGARLKLGAETAQAGGRIVITNRFDEAAGSVEILRASALAGAVTVGKGVRLVLDELPLASVTSLTVGEGATVVLPDEASGYWQIVPVSSTFDCAEGVTFVTASAPTVPLAGSASRSGSFFGENALYRWTGREGEWNRYFANRHPKILFGDIDGTDDMTVRVAAAVSPDFAFFSNLRTRFVFAPASDEASVCFSSVYFCGPTVFEAPVGATEYVEVSTSTSRFAHVTAPYVHVASGAGLALAGSHWTNFRLDAGAVLVAVEGETLDWNADTSFSFPQDGEVLVDVGALALSDEPTPLVAGLGHVWTAADLSHFRLVQPDAEFRLVNNALCVVRGDGLAGPYALAFDGCTNWNCAAWTATTNGVAFRRKWGDCSLDWSADVDVTVTNEGSHLLFVDAEVHANRLSIHAPTNTDVVLRPCGVSEISVATLDLTDAHAGASVELGTGAAAILTPTNETAECRLRRGGTGTIKLSGSTLFLEEPGDFTLAAGSQGTLRLMATQGCERFRAAKVASGFELGGLQLEVCGRDWSKADGFTFAVSDGALWCTPPGLSAEVPPGTNDFTRLAWKDVFGNAVTNVDWQTTTGFELIGTPTSGVVIAKHGFAAYWDKLRITGEVTAYGEETLSPSVLPGGSGTLTLAGRFTVNADLKAHQQLLDATRLGIGPGSTMYVSHGGSNFNASLQDWRGIVGTGRLVFTDPKSSWIALPSQVFAGTLEVDTSSDIVLTQQISTDNPFGARNLSGAGTFRTDWGDGSRLRPVRTVQTRVTEYAGTFAGINGGRDSKLVVGSDAPEATDAKALILSGNNTAQHALDIETNGCVILTGSWKGTIDVKGLLIVTNANALAQATVKGTYVVRDTIPSVTPRTDAYVAPDYPADDPTPPVEPPAPDTRVRFVQAEVGADDATWSRLDWRGPDGQPVANVDWSVVTNVTLTATNSAERSASAPTRVIFDIERLSGVVCLSGVTVEARAVLPFVLAADSTGAVDFRLQPVPTATCDLIRLTPTTLYPLPTITIHDRFGREIGVAGEVVYEAASRTFRLYVQNVDRPNYCNTFDTQYDDSLPSSSALWFNGSGGLTYGAWSDYFEPSRSGRALIGGCMYKFSMHSHNGNPTVAMDDVYVWSLHFVAKLPTNDGGIIFGWGNKDSGNGVALARVSENRAGVYAWKNGGAVQLVASANVPFASSQFHAYAITYDNQTLSFYVDGVLAQAVTLDGKYPTRGFYQWFKMYGQNGTLADGSTAVVDDFRLYVGTCLTPTSVRTIANDFPPWPEHPTAEVDVDGLAWSNLYWSASFDADDALTLRSGAGSLLFDAPVVVPNALAVTGGSVPLVLEGAGALVVPRGLAASSPLEIDASRLDGNELAEKAVAGAPYTRWLVKGPCTGLTPTVTALPALPNRYTAEVDFVSGYGLRLVVHAPRTAKRGSLSLNFAGGNGGANVKVANSCVSTDPTQATQPHGAHPVVGACWNDLSAGNGTETAKCLVSSDGSVRQDASVVVRVSQAKNPYVTGKTVCDRILWGYIDDGNGPVVEVSGIPFARYRVIVYRSTDNDGTVFNPVRIGTSSADACRYFGSTAWSAAGGYTLSGPSDVNWGWTNARDFLAEGANYVVSDVLTASGAEGTVYVSSPKLSSGRACLSAIQVVEVGFVFESQAVDYQAAVTNDTTWANGEGVGLADHGAWVNDPSSDITLTQAVPSATLTFDTALTADVVRVVNVPGQRLRLVPTSADFNVEAVVATAARGELVFDGWSHLPQIHDAAGSHIRFERDVTEPVLATPGAVYSYRSATFASPVSAWTWALSLEEPGDVACFPNSGCYLAIGVKDGTLTLGPASGNPPAEYVYGGTSAASGTNSVLTVNGGTVVCNIAGSETTNGGSTRGLIVGATGSATRAPRILLSSGTFDCSKGVLSPWELCRIVQSGGLLRAKGIWKGGNSESVVDLDGGLLELGAMGIGRRSGSGGAFLVELEGGEIRAVESASVEGPAVLSIASASTLSATNGATLTVLSPVIGSGRLTVGGPAATGTVRFEGTKEWSGSVTVREGARLELASGALLGDVAFETNAVLNLSVPDGLVETAYPLAANLTSLCGDDVRSHLRVNGAELPFYCQVVGGTLVNQLENHRWANPVTGVETNLSLRFAGASNGLWRTCANWETFDTYRWVPFVGETAPHVAGSSCFDPAVLDGAVIAEASNRVVRLDVLAGTTPRLALYHGVTATVERVGRLVGDDSWFWVDDTSRLVLGGFGEGPFEGSLDVDVAAEDGLVFDALPPADGLSVAYGLKGCGSVRFNVPLTNGTHVIRRVAVVLSPEGYGRILRTKRLIAFPTDSTAAFSWANATVSLENPGAAGAEVTPKATDALVSDPVGTCSLERREDGVYLVYVDRLDIGPESRSWRNPVTGESADFSYRFVGTQSGSWKTVGNWETYSVDHWVALTGENVPMLPNNGIFDPTVIDGSNIVAAANRTVTLSAEMEGWTPRLAALNGVTVTVQTVKKFQGTPKWLWVDETSQLKFSGFGSASYENPIQLYVASSNGLVFAANPGGDGVTFQYFLKGSGSVSFGAAVTRCTHQLHRADFRLSPSGFGRTVRTKRLIAFPSATTVAFATEGATVVVDDPSGQLTSGVSKAAVTDADEVGAYALVRRPQGLDLDYVDRAGGDTFVHETSDGASVRQLEIPLDWLMRLTNGPNALLPAGDLSRPAVAAALESTQAANGIRPWQSYLLGLEPTNAADDVRCAIATDADGRLVLSLPNVDPAKQPKAAALRYVLQHKDDLLAEWIDHSTNTETSVTIVPDATPAKFYRYRILFH